MLQKSAEIRADITLRQWGRWARSGVSKIGYPTRPPWSHLVGDSGYVNADQQKIEECDLLVKNFKPLIRVIVTTYYSTLLDKIKNKRTLPRATMLFINAEGKYDKITTRKVNSVIDFAKHAINDGVNNDKD